jgi:hypothetical protein
MGAFLKSRFIGDGAHNQNHSAPLRAVAFMSRDVGGQRNCNAHASGKRPLAHGKRLRTRACCAHCPVHASARGTAVSGLGRCAESTNVRRARGRASGPVPDRVYCPGPFGGRPRMGRRSLPPRSTPPIETKSCARASAALNISMHIEAGADPEVMIAACPSSVTVSCGGVAQLVQSLAGN